MPGQDPAGHLRKAAQAAAASSQAAAAQVRAAEEVARAAARRLEARQAAQTVPIPEEVSREELP